eukprot:COSAG06_NODE_32921_length_498_cov_0.686717_1_plen_107_part_01
MCVVDHGRGLTNRALRANPWGAVALSVEVVPELLQVGGDPLALGRGEHTRDDAVAVDIEVEALARGQGREGHGGGGHMVPPARLWAAQRRPWPVVAEAQSWSAGKGG